MANEQNETRDVNEQIDRAAEIETSALMEGIASALTDDAARTRGMRTGASLGAGATEATIAQRLGFASANDLRGARRGDPRGVINALMSRARR